MNLQESYCSFELSKLLKEKGFDVPIDTYFHDENDFVCENYVTNWNAKEEYVSRPSQALAMKWLREVHGIHIVIEYHEVGNLKCYTWLVKNGRGRMYLHQKVETTYEEAVEAAINYSLENLI